MKRSSALILGTAALVLGMGLLAASSRSAAEGKEQVKQDVQALADALEKGGQAQATKLAAEVAKAHELEDVMNLMALRKPTGKKPTFGVGKMPGQIKPDGIEAQITNLRKRVNPQKVNQDSEALTEMAYRIDAIAHVAVQKPVDAVKTAKQKQDWETWSKEMIHGSQELAKAAKNKNAAGVKAAAAHLDASCNNCHGAFRDQ